MKHVTVVITSALAVVAFTPATIFQPASDLACRIDPSGNTGGPRADVCAQVVRRWRLLTGTTPTPGEIHLVTRRAPNSTSTGGYWTLEWPAPEAPVPSAKGRKREALPAHLAENILPHEAGHHVMMNYLGLTLNKNDYSSPAPDWIDEASAVWMESRAAREQRMRGVAGIRPSLEGVATMVHPGRAQMIEDLFVNDARNVERTVTPPCAQCASLPAVMRTKYRIVTTTIGGDGSKKTVVSYSDTDPNASETVEQRAFYPLAYALLRFVRVRGGVAAIRELFGRYRDNPTPRVAVLLGLPGLPNTVPAFEAEWRVFLRNPPPEDP